VQTVEVRATEGWFGLRSGFGIGAGVGSVIGTGMMLCTLLLLTWWGCARPSASKVLLLVTLQYLFSRYNIDSYKNDFSPKQISRYWDVEDNPSLA
jgi:hypothetical protein